MVATINFKVVAVTTRETVNTFTPTQCKSRLEDDFFSVAVLPDTEDKNS